MKKCPACKSVNLSSKSVDGAQFQYCKRCQGVLFTKEYLGNLVEDAIKNLAVPKKSTEGTRTCAHCPDMQMNSFYYPQTYVTIDMCSRCRSIWLDAGELKEIQLVRSKLKEMGKLETYVAEDSFKASLLNFVNSSIRALSSF